MDHEYYMRICFKLARLGQGYVFPNPMVGAVVVRNDRIISMGFHQKYGDSHAEVFALSSAVESVEDATMYCNLEPCSHKNKKTPPCVPLIISKGIERVVISNIDPNPNVCGNGVIQLRNAGIEVITGILEDEGKKLNERFFKYIVSRGSRF